jgi:hypothetical protein
MKSIKFNDQEIDLLRNLYQYELEEAENYIKKIKSLLNKIGVPIQMDLPGTEVKVQKKRGRKPKVVKEEPVPEVVKKERKKRTVKPKPVKPEEPRIETIVTPVPVKKERKKRVKKEKSVKQAKVKAKKQSTVITFKEKIKPTLLIAQEPLMPIKSIITETAPPQQMQTISGLDMSVVKEGHKIDRVPISPSIIPKPDVQPFYPNSQYVKKKKFRLKRPRIALQNLSKPITVKEDTGTKQSEESQEKVE